jgi:hypothetical protein
MPPKSKTSPDRRAHLLLEIGRLAEVAIYGTLSESFRTCGTPSCRCHGPGPKHGPHLYVSYRGSAGKTAGYYVPVAAQDEIRAGVAAWQTVQERLRELADLTKETALQRARKRRTG